MQVLTTSLMNTEKYIIGDVHTGYLHHITGGHTVGVHLMVNQHQQDKEDKKIIINNNNTKGEKNGSENLWN